MEIETLAKLYLELGNLLPETVVTQREAALKKWADRYAVALMMIAEGCADPAEFARKTLREDWSPTACAGKRIRA